MKTKKKNVKRQKLNKRLKIHVIVNVNVLLVSFSYFSNQFMLFVQSFRMLFSTYYL